VKLATIRIGDGSSSCPMCSNLRRLPSVLKPDRRLAAMVYAPAVADRDRPPRARTRDRFPAPAPSTAAARPERPPNPSPQQFPGASCSCCPPRPERNVVNRGEKSCHSSRSRPSRLPSSVRPAPGGAAVCHQRGSSCPERRIYRGSAAAMPRQNVRAARHDMACKAEPPSSTGAGGRRWTTWTLTGCASRSC
jgi:hypothetical protein